MIKKNELFGGDLKLLSPQRLAPLMIVSIFGAEILVMYLLMLAPPLSPHAEAILDSAILLIILSPTFYFFHYRPIKLHYLGRKESIDRLQNSEERLNLALEAVNDGLCDWDIATGKVYYSPRTAMILGYQPEHLGDRIESWKELIHSEDIANVECSIQDHLNGHRSQFESEYRMRNSNGGWTWILTRAKVVERDADNQPVRMIGTLKDITQRKQAEEALRKSEEEVRALTQQMMHISEEEKKHLAQDLHDEFGQVLTAFKMGVEMLLEHQFTDEQDYQFQCTRLLKLVSRLDTDLRHMCDYLRPMVLDDIGLAAALQWHIQEMNLLDGDMKIKLQAEQVNTRLPRDMEIALFRICQEALNNAMKHSGSSEIRVLLDRQKYKILMTICDDGIGMNPEQMKTNTSERRGFGLIGMRERASAAGGILRIESYPNQGTTIHVELPIGETPGEGYDTYSPG